ncbi:MAG: MFS transporter [Chloroflexi bacterium]|nr:MFS transporter [Chloroflexota bacterium]
MSPLEKTDVGATRSASSGQARRVAPTGRGRLWLALMPWVILAAAFVLRAMESGIRGNFGLFFHPLDQEFGWSRGSVSLAMSIGMITWALVLPFGGRLCDRYGPRRVMAGGIVLAVVALIGASTASRLWHLYFWWGIVDGVAWGLGATVGSVTLLARWFTRNRGLAMSISISGVSAGSMVLVPIGAALLTMTDWRGVFRALALMIVLVTVPVLLFVVRDRPPAQARQEDPGGRIHAQGERVSLRQAFGRGPYRLIALVYVACGVVGMALPVHLIPYAIDRGLSPLAAARAMSVFSAMSIAGVVAFGALSDRIGRKHLLALGYVFRLVGILILVAARGEAMLLAGALFLGIGFNTPGGLIPALVADVYGAVSVGLLTGTLSTMHQIAGALGVWSAGYLFDATGSYALPFLAMAALSVVSGAGALFIQEKAKASVPVAASGGASR